MQEYYWAVHYEDEKTGRKGFNVVKASTNEEATYKVGIFGYDSRFKWIGTEPYKNIE